MENTKYTFYVVRDRYGDPVEIKEVLSFRGARTINVRTHSKECVADQVYPIYFFDTPEDPLSFCEHVESLEIGLSLLVQRSSWVGSEVPDGLMKSANRMDEGFRRFRTDCKHTRDMLISAAERMGHSPIEVILCDRPLYDWEKGSGKA
jgi:hypothetical protein